MRVPRQHGAQMFGAVAGEEIIPVGERHPRGLAVHRAGFAHGREARIEKLDKHIASLGLDANEQAPARRRHRAAFVIGHGSRERIESRDAGKRNAGGKGNGARAGKADAQAREGAGPGRHRDQGQIGKADARLVYHLADHGIEAFGLAALHLLEAPCRDCVTRQDRRRTGGSRGIYAEYVFHVRDRSRASMLDCRTMSEEPVILTEGAALIEIAPPAFDVDIAIAYATADNFTGKPVYGRPGCYLHEEAAKLLARAIALAADIGLRLKIFDAYRPTEAQWVLWNHTPDPDFLADPRRGSPHSRGVAVDLTLIDRSGRELDMGTGFDAFTPLSHHANRDIGADAARNRHLLLGIMTAAGWDFYRNEWWHYQMFESRRFPLVSDKALAQPMMPSA